LLPRLISPTDDDDDDDVKAKTENSRSKSYRYLFQQFPCIPDLELKNISVDPNLVICETETEYQTAAGLKTSQT
jgi:hypothetical protein